MHSMKVGINTLSVTPSRGGSKTYLTNLIRHLVKLDRRNTYFLFVSPINNVLFDKWCENFRTILIPLHSDNRPFRLFYDQFLIPYYVLKYGIDVLFSPNNIATIFPGCKQVLIIQGPLVIRKLRKRYAEQEIPRLQAIFYDFMLPMSVRRVNKIITVSEDIKKWLLKQVEIPPSKVLVIHEGVDLGVFTTSVTKVDLAIDKPYVLFLSTLFRYKNADKAVKAFALAKRRCGIPHKLVIGGRDPDNRVTELRKVTEELGVAAEVQFLGQVPFEQVPFLYKNADLFLYPSTVESFGLPPLEAMACGVPVIGSTRCSIPEIIGDAGLIVDPDNIEELAEAIWKVLTDKKLRENLIKKGYERIKQFSWEKTAKETLKVFEEVYYENIT